MDRGAGEAEPSSDGGGVWGGVDRVRGAEPAGGEGRAGADGARDRSGEPSGRVHGALDRSDGGAAWDLEGGRSVRAGGRESAGSAEAIHRGGQRLRSGGAREGE